MFDWTFMTCFAYILLIILALNLRRGVLGTLPVLVVRVRNYQGAVAAELMRF